MALNPKDIWALTPSEAMDLQARGKAGDVASMAKWVWYAAWSKIRQDRTIPAGKRCALFRALFSRVTLAIDYVTPAVEVPLG